MKRGSTLFLKLIVLLIALFVLAWMIVFPQLEGRAANLDLVSIYTDPLIIYGYVASIPFFVALFQALKLLGYVERDTIFSQAAVQSVAIVKYCAVAIVMCIIGAILYIWLLVQGEDITGPTMMGFVTIFASVVIATAAGVFQRLLQHAVDIKSEHDLTV
ncbi:MAG: DUF2975 domain-containing protein [Chloroflexota bacterium]